MNFRKAFGLALVLTLLLSSCSSSSEEATIDTGIVERLNAATEFSWEIDSPDEGESEANPKTSKGYIQDLWTTNQMECLLGVYVYENDEYAKNAKEQFFIGGGWEDYDGIWQFDDPLTQYGIVFVDAGDPCRDDAASAFDFVIPSSN